MKKVIVVFLMVLTIASLLSLSTTPAFAETGKVMITAPVSLNLRSQPSTASTILGSIPRGEIVDFTAYVNHWYTVSYKNITGYIYDYYTKRVDAPAATLIIQITAPVSLNIRASTSLTSSVIGSIPSGTIVNPLSKIGSYYKVSYNGINGYIYDYYTKVVNPQTGGTIQITATDGMNIRSSMSLTSKILGVIPYGTITSPLAKSGHWYKVSYQGINGYIYDYYTVVVTSGTSTTVLSNKALSWWYTAGPPSTIPSSVASIIAQHRVYWQLPKTPKVVYLTFDVGYLYHNNTIKILDILKAKGVKATFFVTKAAVTQEPAAIARMVSEGHRIGNHTINHYSAPEKISQSETAYINDIVDLNKLVPAMTKLHRPPEGAYSERSLQILDSLGYRAVFWSFAYNDWDVNAQPAPATAKQKITDNLHNGCILLLHAVSDTNVSILGSVIDTIKAKGYTIELLPAN